jgi:hypothetical protein
LRFIKMFQKFSAGAFAGYLIMTATGMATGYLPAAIFGVCGLVGVVGVSFNLLRR